MLTAAAQQAGLAIEKARLLAESTARRRAGCAAHHHGRHYGRARAVALLQAIVERAAGLVIATGGELGLYDEARKRSGLSSAIIWAKTMLAPAMRSAREPWVVWPRLENR